MGKKVYKVTNISKTEVRFDDSHGIHILKPKESVLTFHPPTYPSNLLKVEEYEEREKPVKSKSEQNAKKSKAEKSNNPKPRNKKDTGQIN